MNENSEKVTNLDYLVELSKGNKQFVKDMIKIFLEENPGEMAEFENGIKSADYSLIKAAAHKLRSSIPFVGVDKIVDETLTEIESLAATNVEPEEIEVKTDDPDIQKIQITKTDHSVLPRIEQLFTKVKNVCNKACEELLLLDMA